MKKYNLGTNEILSDDADISYLQDEIQSGNVSSFKGMSYTNSIYDCNCDGSNLIPKIVKKLCDVKKLCIVDKGINPPTLKSDFIDLRKKTKRMSKTSILSDELNNKDCHLKPYEKESGFFKTPLHMHDKEKKTSKGLYNGKSLFKDKKLSTVNDRIFQEVSKYNMRENFSNFSDINIFEDKISKNLKIKYLNAIKKQIPSIIPTENNIRVNESYYPLSSSFLLLGQNNQTGGIVLGDQSQYKRIKQMIFDKKEQDYKYLLEEKFPEMENEDYFDKRSDYYCDWLDSQNNQQAHDLAEGIVASKSKDLKVFILLNSNKFKLKGSKVYLRQLSKNAQKHIKTMPYMRRKTVYNINKSFPELVEMSINQKYLDVVNYTPTFRDDSEGLKWVKYFRTKHLLDFNIQKINTKFKFSDSNIVDTFDFSFCMDCQKNEQGRTVSSRCNIWHQCWVEDGIFYAEYYSTFVINDENSKIPQL